MSRDRLTHGAPAERLSSLAGDVHASETVDDLRSRVVVPAFLTKGITLPEHGDVQRAILPIPDRPHVGLVTYDAKDPNTKYPPIEPVRPPDGAPNVLVILIDDVGFGASSAFGGPCETPNFEKLANAGLRYNRFHRRPFALRRAPRCSPAVTTIRWAWTASPRSRPRHPETTRCDRTRRLHSRRHF